MTFFETCLLASMILMVGTMLVVQPIMYLKEERKEVTFKNWIRVWPKLIGGLLLMLLAGGAFFVLSPLLFILLCGAAVYSKWYGSISGRGPLGWDTDRQMFAIGIPITFVFGLMAIGFIGTGLTTGFDPEKSDVAPITSNIEAE